jgi:putative pyruvate formate lyase activating enzyme
LPCRSGGDRTLDPMIKSHVLYQLSYGPKAGANLAIFRKIQVLFYIVLKELDHCVLCPRACGVNRNVGQLGYCGSNAGYSISSICIHHGEEPPISGLKGICNVFFTGCNLTCLFCQNYQISRQQGKLAAKPYTLEEVTDKIIDHLNQGIEAVGFVTPTHHSPHVKAIINRLNRLGYTPITVYNTNCYDKVNILSCLEGLIDVYLPDFKYFNPAIAGMFSDASDYPDAAKKSLLEMYRQKGSTVVLNDSGQAVTGMIIRHLVLPGQSTDSINLLTWIARELSPSVSISLMSQYCPTVCIANHPVLDRRINAAEYQVVMDGMENLGFNNGWIQQHESADHYNPDFNNESPFGF